MCAAGALQAFFNETSNRTNDVLRGWFAAAKQTIYTVSSGRNSQFETDDKGALCIRRKR